MSDLHVLAIFAHRDDAELTCAGTLIKLASQGYRTGILDLTEGEMGTLGSPEIRAREAAKAGAVMGLAVRENLGLPDAGIVNTPETRRMMTRALRTHRPAIVITHAQQGRHPDPLTSAPHPEKWSPRHAAIWRSAAMERFREVLMAPGAASIRESVISDLGGTRHIPQIKLHTQATGEGHFCRRHRQPALAQVVACPHQLLLHGGVNSGHDSRRGGEIDFWHRR